MRSLVLVFTLAIVVSAVAFPQAVVDPAKVRDLLTRFESHAHEQLRCEVIPIKPALNFAFRFQAGFIVHVPLNQYSGKGHRWVMLVRVTPDGGETVPLMSVINLPEIPQTKAVAEIGGGYLVGEGHYEVQWMMFDDGGRVCRKNWTVEPKPTRAERGIRVAIPPKTVRSFFWFAEPGERSNFDDAAPVRLTVLLHAAPISTRRTTLRASDSLMLVGLLSSLLERLPTRSVRLVVFSLDQQAELFRQESFSPKALDQVQQAISNVQLGVVDYRVLQNRHGHVDLLANLINAEVHAKEPSDVVLFLGPTARYADSMPQDALERLDAGSPQFFYFQYRPYYRRAATFSDVITASLRRLHGKTLLIHSPNEFAKAIQQVERAVRPAPSAASEK